jgi:dUTP pyrophosphatase
MYILIKRSDNCADIPLPAYATDGAAGMDLSAAVVEPVTIFPGTRKLIPCGFSMAISPGFEAQVRPRSGLALKHGITVLNSPGTIDSDYRGNIGVILYNSSDDDFMIDRGMRIAQMVITRVEHIDIELVTALPITQRGEGGYGSTGTGIIA